MLNSWLQVLYATWHIMVIFSLFQFVVDPIAIGAQGSIDNFHIGDNLSASTP